MKTDSIKRILELYGSNNKQIETLVINRFDIDGKILNVDFNDLLLFPNLNELTINQCILDYNSFELINKLHLNDLNILNCEIIDDISDIITNLDVRNINIDNTNFNLIWFKDLYFDSVSLHNMVIDVDFIINTKVLDIRKSEIKDMDFLTTNVIPKLIISENQYNNFGNYNGNLVIMEENGEFVLSEVKNG